jgi:hypothetical protein
MSRRQTLMLAAPGLDLLKLKMPISAATWAMGRVWHRVRAATGPRRSGAHSRGALVVISKSDNGRRDPVVRACRIVAFQSFGATRIRFPSGSAARKVSPNPAS